MMVNALALIAFVGSLLAIYLDNSLAFRQVWHHELLAVVLAVAGVSLLLGRYLK